MITIFPERQKCFSNASFNNGKILSKPRIKVNLCFREIYKMLSSISKKNKSQNNLPKRHNAKGIREIRPSRAKISTRLSGIIPKA